MKKNSTSVKQLTQKKNSMWRDNFEYSFQLISNIYVNELQNDTFNK